MKSMITIKEGDDGKFWTEFHRFSPDREVEDKGFDTIEEALFFIDSKFNSEEPAEPFKWVKEENNEQ